MGKFLVVGASGSIGQAVVTLLASSNNEVITTARDASVISPDVIIDATDFDGMEQIFKDNPSIVGVVNCAGSLLLKPAHLTTHQELLEVLNASFVTSFSVVRAAGKYMKNGGAVVLISSAAALVGLPNHEAIAGAKSALHGLALSAAATYAQQKLRFNVVAPGLVDTKLTSFLTKNELSRKASEAMHPLGRIGQTHDIAKAILFLLNPENSWITGQIIGVDGGLSSLRTRK